MSLQDRKVIDGAQPFLDDGEEVLAAFVARPRGWTQAAAGSIQLGAAQQGRSYAAGERAELQLASPMALAVTQPIKLEANAVAGAKPLAQAFARAKAEA